MNVRALAGAVSQLEKENKPLANALQGVLAFEPPEMLAAGEKVTQLDYLRTKSIKKLEWKEDYLHPQDPPLTLPNVQGVKIYVLGPPRDIEWIKKLEKKSELYPELAVMDEDTALAAGIFAASGTDSLEGKDKQLIQRSRPFDEACEITKDQIEEDEELRGFFRKNYGFSERRGHGLEWRRIDTDWLVAAEQLALRINSKINNTSLVLAIELTDILPHKVLLFAADAQVGNWLSWQELSWPVEGDDGERVTAEDLLRRTVLYKVGHHGSRNATLSHKGLEMMASPNLVAMIPVDEEWANQEKHWEHPAEKLLERLKEKTRNRIIRTDKIPTKRRPGKPSHVVRSEWNILTKQLDWDHSSDKLWIQYTVTM